MTENSTKTDVKGAKAQAAADKAYRKASRPWFKKKRFIFPLILVLIIIITVASNSGKKDATTTSSPEASTPSTQASPAKAAAAAFPGAKDTDVVGKGGDALKIGDATVTSTALINGDATLGATLCTTVSLQNASKDTLNFTIFDWKLQSPSGTILTSGFSGSKNLLSTGEIAPGGTATGDVCFDNKQAAPGQYIALYQPTFKFFTNRAAWINTL
ncbi:DUF4352 domain-containing protein [Arthrobacter oryzae]|uniref:DUF4352 domain-containing protein n=1 Tax=Arthrobacter oryzae TaxID=409290 RepID=A0A3N0BMK7_9MICC|nr:DUF4352 domain-containing protein [Arthrobacter oryzae]RNL49481.1 DUF4352 domain-containing protein [Arthrobacter oryzae]